MAETNGGTVEVTKEYAAALAHPKAVMIGELLPIGKRRVFGCPNATPSNNKAT
jgi:hypothetical protein